LLRVDFDSQEAWQGERNGAERAVDSFSLTDAAYSRRILANMISKYIQKALERARYEQLENGGYCATVSGLRGVIALGGDVEECRSELAEVVEEWILVRVARQLDVPKLGGVTVRVRRAG
jgi:predicted RNase H-like HicB family nuclease